MAKIRGGFVSNSSSSSFIITLPSDKEISFDTVAQELIPGKDPSEVCFIAYDDPIDASSAISSVVHEICAGMKDKSQDEYEQELADTLSGFDAYCAKRLPKSLIDLADKAPDYDTVMGKDYFNKPSEERHKRWEYYEQLRSIWETEFASAILAHYKGLGRDVYVVEYSDNDGSFSTTMEHGDVFDELINKGLAFRISHH